ncbi:DUF6538 domain-containing protein [Novacetimonas cocois]
MATLYMTRRRACWYLRVRISSDLRPMLRTHLVRTLRTSDKKSHKVGRSV